MKPLKFFKDRFYIEFTVTTVLFLVALSMNKLMEAIIYMLYFIIFLEIVRTVVNYVREQRVIISSLVDAFIILALRELIVNLVKINNETIKSFDDLFASSLNHNLLVIAGVILFLLLVRYLAVKTSYTYLIENKKTKKEEIEL
ncbi:phosphate-starvation-inducible PsiE family protein [Halarcobacter sp.]|uniref:phosphate-starvation-inducible PsiE family protein n=1 Tax=Halarcobacter sp. TaxID=2321133 RepID=UPI0029F4E162|nr:phosphate-starvation-inducible PsiE family protein [Halarcobacter sp.]